MNIFTLLAVFAFLVVGTGTLVALGVVAFGIKRRPLRVTALWACLCLVPMVCLIVAYGWMFGPADYIRPQDLAKAYHAEFGCDPPSDVTEFRVRVASVGDWWGAWHRFRAASTTIDSLLVKFEPTDRLSFSEATRGADIPTWWTPDAEGIDMYYVAHHWSSKSDGSRAYMGINRDKGIVYFHHGES